MLFRSNLTEPGFIKAVKPDQSIPDKDSFFWRAFEENHGIAENALNTPFMQGIKNGNLPPDVYGSFTVLDSYYCYNSACSFRMAYTNAQNKGIEALASTLLYLTNRYEKYNEIFLKVWHIADSNDVVPTDLWKGYAAHERRVALEEHPIYTAIIYGTGSQTGLSPIRIIIFMEIGLKVAIIRLRLISS